MENEIKDVSLAFCCKENWNGFETINDRTRYCASCKHKVIDFTNASQSELNESLKSGTRVCGRFKSSQLSQSFLRIAAASLIATTVTTSCSDEPVQLELQPPQSEEIFELMGEVVTMGVVEIPDTTMIQLNSKEIK